MSQRDAELALSNLESCDAGFDYAKADRYVILVKNCLRRTVLHLKANGLPYSPPFIDPLERICPDLSSDLVVRLEKVVAKHGWSTGYSCMAKACLYHLKFLSVKEHLSPSECELLDFYSPIIDLIHEGGRFYRHHCDYCIEDAATIIYQNLLTAVLGTNDSRNVTE